MLVLLAAGVFLYGADASQADWGGFIVGLVAGAVCFCSLGMALVPFIKNEDAAPAVVNVTILPLLFISDIFIPLPQSTPEAVTTIASIFPPIHFAHALLYSFVRIPGSPFTWTDIGILLIWTAIGLFVAITRFSWQPRR